jgi:hypothetical protein
LMIEGFGSGSITLTNGSGSGSRRPEKHTDPDSEPQHCPAKNVFPIWKTFLFED